MPSLGQKALKLELIERPEAISNIMFANAIKYYLEKSVIEKRTEDEKGKERDQEFYWDSGNRLLIQHYSKQISRFLRSPHFACSNVSPLADVTYQTALDSVERVMILIRGRRLDGNQNSTC